MSRIVEYRIEGADCKTKCFIVDCMVGSYDCDRCGHHVSNDLDKKVVVCKYECKHEKSYYEFEDGKAWKVCLKCDEIID